MKSKYLVITLFIIILFIPGVNAIQVSTSYSSGDNSGGSSVNLAVPYDGTLNGKAILGDNGGITQSIAGTGSMGESHFVQNADGARAEISVNIVDSENYDYSYALYPGEGGGWSSKSVSAGETLTVLNAASITADAKASNSGGDRADVILDTFDDLGRASIEGYSNYAEASKGGAKASQRLEGLSSQSGQYADLIEIAQNLNAQSYHNLRISGVYFTLGGYSADVSANGGTDVAADYTQLNLSNEFYGAISDYTGAFNQEPNSAAVSYNSFFEQFRPIIGAYSSKAGTKGKKVNAESTIQVDYPPLQVEHLPIDYVSYIENPYLSFPRTWHIDQPGTYTAMAKFDGKKANVIVEQV